MFKLCSACGRKQRHETYDFVDHCHSFWREAVRTEAYSDLREVPGLQEATGGRDKCHVVLDMPLNEMGRRTGPVSLEDVLVHHMQHHVFTRIALRCVGQRFSRSSHSRMIQGEHITRFHTDTCFIGNCQLWHLWRAFQSFHFHRPSLIDAGRRKKEARWPPAFADPVESALVMQ